jgi:hypothetical protein
LGFAVSEQFLSVSNSMKQSSARFGGVLAAEIIKTRTTSFGSPIEAAGINTEDVLNGESKPVRQLI